MKAAFKAKGTWSHCDGTSPMPMPGTGPNFFSPSVNSTNLQPELLDERRAWSKKDRDVKLDIFLSVVDEIKLEIFEVGPPLPPSSMTALEMMQALDERFESFKFEEYHHAFCHFLNLHIDQYASIEEFNTEFQATLDDLLDHGYPMDNVQACSAYFSKLRCTQNPWVAKKLKEWDSTSPQPALSDLMRECPPWMVIRPLATKQASPSQHSTSVYSEDIISTPSLKADDDEDSGAISDSGSEKTPSASTSATHSRNTSTESSQSQEITIHASADDLSEVLDFPMPSQILPTLPPPTIPKRISSKLSMVKLTPLQPLSLPPPPPINRPLPPLPVEALQVTRSRSTSPNSRAPLPPRKSSAPTSRSQTPQPDQSSVHPAMRSLTPTPQSSFSTPHLLTAPSTPDLQRPNSSHGPPTLSTPYLTPELTIRPSSSRSNKPHGNLSTFPTPPRSTPTPLLRIESSASSIISLPLQGASFDPEYQDTIIHHSNSPHHSSSLPILSSSAPDSKSTGLGLQFETPRNSPTPPPMLLDDPARFSSSPPKSLMSKLGAELMDEDRRSRKRSWSIKARVLSRRYEVKEMI